MMDEVIIVVNVWIKKTPEALVAQIFFTAPITTISPHDAQNYVFENSMIAAQMSSRYSAF
jgi:hypothetical protein